MVRKKKKHFREFGDQNSKDDSKFTPRSMKQIKSDLYFWICKHISSRFWLVDINNAVWTNPLERTQGTNGCVCRLQASGYPRRAYFSYPTYYVTVNGSTAVWKSLVWNWEADWARDKRITSERSVGRIANQVDGHGTAASLLWISGGIEVRGNFPAELFASSDRHSVSHCSALSFF